MDKDFYRDLIKPYGRYKSKNDLKNLCYKALIDSFGRVKRIQGINGFNENKIRDRFIIDLDQNNELIKHALKYDLIILIPESYDALKRKRSDIRVKISHCCELIFECKKLSSAEGRYLTDGLIRFILLDYAEGEDEAGMTGFIFNANIPVKLKEKVDKFYCVRLINKPVFGYPDSFQSIHKRKNSTEILITHLFFLFNS